MAVEGQPEEFLQILVDCEDCEWVVLERPVIEQLAVAYKR
jgi:hypothetical protein